MHPLDDLFRNSLDSVEVEPDNDTWSRIESRLSRRRRRRPIAVIFAFLAGALCMYLLMNSDLLNSEMNLSYPLTENKIKNQVQTDKKEAVEIAGSVNEQVTDYSGSVHDHDFDSFDDNPEKADTRVSTLTSDDLKGKTITTSAFPEVISTDSSSFHGSEIAGSTPEKFHTDHAGLTNLFSDKISLPSGQPDSSTHRKNSASEQSVFALLDSDTATTTRPEENGEMEGDLQKAFDRDQVLLVINDKENITDKDSNYFQKGNVEINVQDFDRQGLVLIPDSDTSRGLDNSPETEDLQKKLRSHHDLLVIQNNENSGNKKRHKSQNQSAEVSISNGDAENGDILVTNTGKPSTDRKGEGLSDEFVKSKSKVASDSLPLDLLPDSLTKEEKKRENVSELLSGKEPVRRFTRFLVEGYVSPHISYRTFTTDTLLEAVESRSADKVKTAFSAGLKLKSNISKSSLMTAGISYSRFGERATAIALPDNFDVTTGSTVPSGNFSNPPPDPIETEELTLNYSYLGLDLGLEKMFYSPFFTFSLHSSMTANILVSEESTYFYCNQEEVNGTYFQYTTYQNNQVNLNKATLMFSAGLSVHKVISRSLWISGGPDFKYFLTSIYSRDAGVKHKPYAGGIRFSLTKTF